MVDLIIKIPLCKVGCKNCAFCFRAPDGRWGCDIFGQIPAIAKMPLGEIFEMFKEYVKSEEKKKG